MLHRPPLRVQFLTEQQKNYSYQWAREMLALRDVAEAAGRPLVIVFSDENRFCLDSDRRWVRYRRGPWNQTALRLMTKFPKGVMVWGAIGPGFKSPLIRCSAGVGSWEYLRILEESNVVAQCDQLYGDRQWLFQQDGAPARKAGISKNVIHGGPECSLRRIHHCRQLVPLVIRVVLLPLRQKLHAQWRSIQHSQYVSPLGHDPPREMGFESCRHHGTHPAVGHLCMRRQFVSMYVLIPGAKEAWRPLPLLGRFPFTT
jgi:hypothetical protein